MFKLATIGVCRLRPRAIIFVVQDYYRSNWKVASLKRSFACSKASAMKSS
jgi:hypothetical protein